LKQKLGEISKMAGKFDLTSQIGFLPDDCDFREF